MGMYFPWEAAAWSLGVTVTWLQPCLFSASLLASWSSPQQSRGRIDGSLGPGLCVLGPHLLSAWCTTASGSARSSRQSLPSDGLWGQKPTQRQSRRGMSDLQERGRWGHPGIAGSIPSPPTAAALLLGKPSWQQWHYLLQRAPAKHITAICVMG